jgi:DNA gyrase subunit A
MKFRAGDELLAMAVVEDGEANVLTATDGGYAKRTPIQEYRVQGRGGLGVKAAKIDEENRGVLVGALVVSGTDEILAITSSGTVIRTGAQQVRQTGRDTMGVRLVNLGEGDSVVSVTRNAEVEEESVDSDEALAEVAPQSEGESPESLG